MSVSTDSFSGDLLRSLRVGDTERVLSVAFHPTKQYMAFGCENSSVKLWNIRSKLYVSIVPHMGNVHALQFSHDGTLLCSAASGHAEGNTLSLWECMHDVKNDEDMSLRLTLSDTQIGPRRMEILHQNDILGVAFAPTRSKVGTVMLASCSRDTTVRLWHFPPGFKMNRQTLRHHDSPVNAVTFSDDGKYLVSGSQSGEIVFSRIISHEGVLEDAAAAASLKAASRQRMEDDNKGGAHIVDLEEELELAPQVELMSVFRFNAFEPVLDVRFFPGFDFITLVGMNVKENGPDRQYRLAVGTETSVCVLKLHDTYLPMYEDGDIADYLIDTAEQDVRRTKFSEDNEVGFSTRRINYSQVTMQMREYMGQPVRSVECAPISSFTSEATMRAAAEAAAANAVASLGEDDSSPSTPVPTAASNRSVPSNSDSKTMQGYLKTKTDQQVLGKRLWKKFYYVLDTSQGQLIWYKSESMTGAPKGFIRLDTIRRLRLVRPNPRSPIQRYRFKIKVIGGATVALEAPSRGVLTNWVAAIEVARSQIRPNAVVLCAAVGNEVRAFALQSAAFHARRPTRQQMRAETLVPEVYLSAHTVIGRHDDAALSIALPSEELLRKFAVSGLIEPGEFLTASASFDQSARVFRWTLLKQRTGTDSDSDADDDGDEERPQPDGSHLAPAEEGNYTFRPPAAPNAGMLYLPAGGNPDKPWIRLERPLTQHQLTSRVEAESAMRLNLNMVREVAPAQTRRGEPIPADVSHLRLVKDKDMEEDSEEDFDLDELGIPDVDDEAKIMEALSRRLVGPAHGTHEGSSQTAVAVQAVPKAKLETVAEQLMERAATAVETDEDLQELLDKDTKVTGSLAGFAHMAAREEQKELMRSRESCSTGECSVL